MYIIRFEQLNIVKSKQKAFPRVVRIPLNEGVCYSSDGRIDEDFFRV